jgi:hypothetical protein
MLLIPAMNATERGIAMFCSVSRADATSGSWSDRRSRLRGVGRGVPRSAAAGGRADAGGIKADAASRLALHGSASEWSCEEAIAGVELGIPSGAPSGAVRGAWRCLRGPSRGRTREPSFHRRTRCVSEGTGYRLRGWRLQTPLGLRVGQTLARASSRRGATPRRSYSARRGPRPSGSPKAVQNAFPRILWARDPGGR